jgi:tetratricopeptide (TPR) repeat protein
MKPVDLKVEILGGGEEETRPLYSAVWKIQPPVNRGDRVVLRYRMDQNQILELKMWLATKQDVEPFEVRIENPISNVVNPNAVRDRIQEKEEKLRTGVVAKEDRADTVVEIARDYAEIDQNEKAISYLKRALQMKGKPDAYLLNLLGIYSGEIGDWVKEEKYYREAAKADPNFDAPLFNLALSQQRRKLYEEAYETVSEAIARDSDGPNHTLAAQIAAALEKEKEADDHLSAAMEGYGPLRSLSDWELGWYLHLCRMTGDSKKEANARKEQKRRNEKSAKTSKGDGSLLPEIAPVLKKR